MSYLSLYCRSNPGHLKSHRQQIVSIDYLDNGAPIGTPKVGISYNPAIGGVIRTWGNCATGNGGGSGTLSYSEVSMGVSTSSGIFSNLASDRLRPTTSSSPILTTPVLPWLSVAHPQFSAAQIYILYMMRVL